MINPAISLFWVRALNCLQNSMMLICAGPNAGPTGGAGVALPASICNFTCACTFFGAICLYSFEILLGKRLAFAVISVCAQPSAFSKLASLSAVPASLAKGQKLSEELVLRHFLHLPKLQLHRRGSPENRNHH